MHGQPPLLTNPASHTQVNVHRSARLYLPSQFQHTAATSCTWAWYRIIHTKGCPGLSAKFNPHFHYNPHLKDGVATLEFDISIDEHIEFYVEMREYPGGKNFITGPSIAFENGALVHKDGGKTVALMRMPPRKWFHIAMKTDLGDNPKETFELTVTPDGGEPKSFTLKKMNKDMRHLDWFGFVADGEDFADCWLDNIQLKVSD